MTNYHSELFRFALFPNYNNAIKFLADTLAESDDNWDFTDVQVKTYSILKNYLEFTFRKLQEEKKIAFTHGRVQMPPCINIQSMNNML
jgi:hypothetical protein